MKGSSNLPSSLVTRLKENVLAYGGIHHLDLSNMCCGPRELSVLADAIKYNTNNGEGGNPIATIELTNNPLCGVNARQKGNYDADGFNDFCNAWITIGKTGPYKLRQLNFSCSVLLPRGFAIVGNPIANPPSSLNELILQQCLGGPEAMEKLAEGLKVNKTLTLLDISDNPIHANGAQPLLDAIASQQRLKQLFLNSCALQSEGISILSHTISNHPVLEVISINDNDFGDKGCDPLAHFLKSNSKLKQLDIQENGINNEGMYILCEKGLTKNKSLVVIGLQWNDLTNEAAEGLGEMLHTNNSLKAIHILGNHIDLEGIEIIIKGSLVNDNKPIDLDVSYAYYAGRASSAHGSNNNTRPATRERKVLKSVSATAGDGTASDGEGNASAPAAAATVTTAK